MEVSAPKPTRERVSKTIEPNVGSSAATLQQLSELKRISPPSALQAGPTSSSHNHPAETSLPRKPISSPGTSEMRSEVYSLDLETGHGMRAERTKTNETEGSVRSRDSLTRRASSITRSLASMVSGSSTSSHGSSIFSISRASSLLSSGTKSSDSSSPWSLQPICETVPVTWKSYDADRFVGDQRHHRVPEDLETLWEEEVGESLDVDLTQILNGINVSDRKDIMTVVELRMTGKMEPGSSMPEFVPTVWISCRTVQVQTILQRAINKLNYVTQWNDAPPHVAIDTIRLCALQEYVEKPRKVPATTSFEWCSSARLPGMILRSGGRPLVCEIERNTQYDSACGPRLSLPYLSQGRFLSIDAHIGGFIKVQDEIFGLSSAHGILDVSNILEKNTDGGIETGPASHQAVEPILLNSDGEIPIGVDLDLHFSRSVTQADLRAVSYGHRACVEGDIQNFFRVSDFSDFALLKLDSSLLKLQNQYTVPATHDAPARTYYVDQTNSEASKGDIWILTDPSKPTPGFLLKSTARLVEKDGVLKTTKLELENPLKAGCSGSWVVRGSALLGMIVAASEDKPLAYMIPISAIFKSINSALNLDGHPSFQACLPGAKPGKHKPITTSPMTRESPLPDLTDKARLRSRSLASDAHVQIPSTSLPQGLTEATSKPREVYHIGDSTSGPATTILSPNTIDFATVQPLEMSEKSDRERHIKHWHSVELLKPSRSIANTAGVTESSASSYTLVHTEDSGPNEAKRPWLARHSRQNVVAGMLITGMIILIADTVLVISTRYGPHLKRIILAASAISVEITMVSAMVALRRSMVEGFLGVTSVLVAFIFLSSLVD